MERGGDKYSRSSLRSRSSIRGRGSNRVPALCTHILTVFEKESIHFVTKFFSFNGTDTGTDSVRRTSLPTGKSNPIAFKRSRVVRNQRAECIWSIMHW